WVRGRLAAAFRTGLAFADFLVVLTATRSIPVRACRRSAGTQMSLPYVCASEVRSSVAGKALEPAIVRPARLAALGAEPLGGALPLGLAFRHVAQFGCGAGGLGRDSG